MRGFLGLAVFLLAAQLRAGGVEVRSEFFLVISEMDGGAAQRAAVVLEKTRRRLDRLGFRPAAPHLPLTAVLVPTVVEMAPYLGESWGRGRGLAFRGSDRHYMVLAWNVPGKPEIALAHEYAHLSERDHNAPLWFREGMAEYLARLKVEADGSLGSVGFRDLTTRLASTEWVSLSDLLTAERGSPAFRDPSFYPLSWLAVHWLASAGGPLWRLSPERMKQRVAAAGAAAVESRLREYAERLSAQDAAGEGRNEARKRVGGEAEGVPVQVRALESWETAFWRAEIDREMRRTERARKALAGLLFARPGEPCVAAALGALEMDRGRYAAAERLLRIAAAGPAPEARTRYRLALVLMQPGAGSAEERAAEAVRQARLAHAAQPDAPRYTLTLAQAAMTAGKWNEAAEMLARQPSWREQADEEFRELGRRRRQLLRFSSPPRLAGSAAAPAVPEWLSSAPSEVFPPPPPAPPPPPPQPRRLRPRWPPPGSTIIYGRIATVECSGAGKFVVLKNPLFVMKFRERPERPAALYNPPLKWKTIPCGTRGWEVALAYRPRAKLGPVRGELLAILF